MPDFIHLLAAADMIIYPQHLPIRGLLFSIKGSIIPVIWRKVMFTVLVSALVVVAHGLLYDHHMLLTATPFTLWGLTLATFLAFRNNVAYQRFWEARTLWGELLIVSRNLARQSRVLLPSLPAEQRGRLVRLLVVFSYALRDMLRGQPTGADIQRVFGDEADTLPTSPTRCSVSPAAG